VAYSPDGRTAVSGGFVGDFVDSVVEPGELILWDLETGREIRRFGGQGEGHPSGVQAVAYSPDGRTVLASSGLFTTVENEYSLILWDVETGKLVRRFDADDESFSVAISPDGSIALTGGDDNDVYLWDLNSGENTQILKGHQAAVTALSFTPDGRRVMSGDWNGRLILWNLATGAPIMQAKVHRSFSVWSAGDPPPANVALTPDGRAALSSTDDGTLIRWDLFDAGEIRRFEGHTVAVWQAIFTPDGKRALTSAAYVIGFGPDADDNSVRLWDVETGEQIRVYEGHSDVLSIAIGPDGRRMLSGSFDGSVRLWDLESGDVIHHVPAYPGGAVFALAFSPDGRTGLSGPYAGGNDVVLWDLESGEAIHRFAAGDDNCTTLFYNPDGRTAYAAMNGLTLLDLETGQEIHRFASTEYCSTGFAIHPDGRTAFMVSNDDRILREWDLENDREIRVFGEHSGARTRVAITPDGRYLLSSGFDGTLFLWDVETGREIRRYKSDDIGMVFDIDISPDGRTALVPGVNSAVVLLRLDLPIVLEDVREWIAANRYVRELTCEERETYRIEPLCEE
jgi:WD40 repeat protein